MKFKISVHKTPYSSKPTDIYNLQTPYTTTEVTLEDIKRITLAGHTVVPALLHKGYRNGKNFRGSQVVYLDYDDNQTPQIEIDKLKEYGLEVNFMYNSFSHKPDHNKFRLCIVFDTLIEDSLTYKNIVTALIGVSGSDEACKDVSRMFFAGNDFKVINEEINQWDEVSGALTDLINKDKCLTAHKRTVSKMGKVTNRDISYRYIGISESVTKTHNKLQNFDFKQACENSTVFNQFDKGEVHLKYAQLRSLISAMMFVKGGLKYVKDKMVMRGDYNGDDRALLRRIPNANYQHAENISSFDSSLAGEYRDITELDGRQRKVIHQIRELNKVDVGDGYDNMINHYYNAMKSVNRVSILMAWLGTGKSTFMIQQENILIALPTHALKNELAEKMEAGGFDFVITPSPPEFKNKDLAKRYYNLQKMGESSLASNLVKQVSEGKDIDNIDYKEEDMDIAIAHKTALEIAYNSEVTVLTTHSRLMLTPDKFKNKDTIFFDEDITNLLMYYKSISYSLVMSQLDGLIKRASKGSDFDEDLRMVRLEVSNIAGNVIGTLRTSVRFKDRNGFFSRLASMEGYNGLATFINSKESRLLIDAKRGENGEVLEGVANFWYGEVREIPEMFSKVIVFSATADRYFYDKLLKGIEYDYFHSGIAKNLTPITQHTEKSYSKGSMDRGEFPDVPEGDVIITHKSHSKESVYFGNVEGFDGYKGKALSVVGTPIEPVNATIFKSLLLGLTYDTNIKSDQIAETDYYTFPAYTFEDKNLRDIEIRTILPKMIQANRARTTRTDAKVNIFSSLPSPDSDVIEGKLLIKSINKNLPDLSTVFIEIKVFSYEDLAREFEEAIKNDNTILYDYQRDDVIQLEIFKQVS